MTTLRQIALLWACLLGLIFVSSFAVAQTYVQKYSPPSITFSPGDAPKTILSPCYFCVDRKTPTLWRWNLYNRASDRDVLMRSDLNPESDLEYMLRTF
jgi:hypothetical protein